MTDSKKTKTEKTAAEETPIVVEEANMSATITEDLDDDSNSAVLSSINPIVEELPDDVKKKLEERKNERNKKSSKGKAVRKKKSVKKNVPMGKVFVQATYNNTIISITDMTGAVISWASAGMAGFKGAKKATPYAAQIIARIAVDKAKELGLKEVMVFVKGVGTGREASVRALNANGLIVSSIKDITPFAHNGCRAKKPRRV